MIKSSLYRYRYFIILLVCLICAFGYILYNQKTVTLVYTEEGAVAVRAQQLANELNSLIKAHKITNKKIDLYVANFTKGYVPQIKHKDRFNIFWDGGFGKQPIDELSSFNLVLSSTPDLLAYLESFNIKAILFPLFATVDTAPKATCAGNFISPDCFVAVIGKEPMVQNYLVQHRIPFHQFEFANNEVIQQLTPILDNLSAVITSSSMFSPQSLDVSPLFVDVMARHIPILTHNQYNSQFSSFTHIPLFIYLFGDLINYYNDRNDIEIFFNDYERVSRKAEKAFVYINNLLSLKSQALKLFYLITNGKDISLRVPSSYNIISPTYAGLYNNGDYWIAKDLEEEFGKKHTFSMISCPLNIFNDFADVNIYIRGGIPLAVNRKKDTQINLMYILFPLLSNEENFDIPDDIYAKKYFAEIEEEQHKVDAIISTSFSFAHLLNKQGIYAHYIPQFTNTLKFYPDYTEQFKSDVLFIGNKTFYRKVPQILIKHNVSFDLYGDGWDGKEKAKYVDNKILRQYYSSAKIVLNDSRPLMLKYGFISNRIFDVSASGGFVISDYMPEIKEIYGDCVPMWKTEDELVSLIKYYLDPKNEQERLAKAQCAQKITLKNFTVDKVVSKFEEVIDEIKNEKSLP